MSLEFFKRKKNSNPSFRIWEIDSQKSQAITTQKFWMNFDSINEIESTKYIIVKRSEVQVVGVVVGGSATFVR